MWNETRSTSELLNAELQRRIRANPRYSLRAFAKALGLSPGALSEILRGKRKLSPKNAQGIAQRLGWSGAELDHLLLLVSREKLGSDATPFGEASPAREKTLSIDLFHVVSDWHCFAIVCLAEIPGFRADAEWIGKRLGLSAHVVRDALNRLERVGLLERADGKLRIAPDFVMTETGIPSEAIRNYHRQCLEKATQALESQNPTERDVTGLSFAIDPLDVPAIRREITGFRDRLVARYSREGRKKEVYQLETCLFRLSEPVQVKK